MCYLHNQWYDISCATLYNFRTVNLERPSLYCTKHGMTVLDIYAKQCADVT